MTSPVTFLPAFGIRENLSVHLKCSVLYRNEVLVAGNAISLSFFSVVKCLVAFLSFRIWRFSFVIIDFLLFVPEWAQVIPRSQTETHTAFSWGGRGSGALRGTDFAVVTSAFTHFLCFPPSTLKTKASLD